MQSKIAVVLAVSTALASSALAEPSQELIDAAKREGMLTTIALPHNWCNYGAVIQGFKDKYGLKVNELNPNAGSADELEAVKANRGNTGPQAPDVLDVGLSFGPAAKAQNLLQPYKVSTWDSIPDDAKDPEGYWYGDYYGVLGFAVNKDIFPEAPTSFEALKDSSYGSAVALQGDPRTGNSVMMAVYAAGVAEGGEPGEDAMNKGIRYFKTLQDNGNLVPVNGNAQNLAQGTTPIYFDWDYNLLAMRDELDGNPPVEVIVPSDAVIAGVYVQAISAYAPHPNAAKLWMEYLYSDEGQLKWLDGYCHPIRFNDMNERGIISKTMLDKLPPAQNYAKAVFPSLADQAAAKSAVAANWGTEMGQ
ncbi:ABC transporter substrate-binding protein [Fulvimarina sp. 2208YS6-2-32]|uniref:ABC transporter substrate-binding protein n=2 Tax=Fulvimarina uroteuthidis TaxID=3098149 RepID=A0ABU5I1Z7_9HYPH|nr:ABC transporter substrate-binding protein [Fulvimarina sp. 2208YS6-2-32]MDY8109008.1 ABC transporter substrate-binding protein [Fulvimarina sp. 2208YS6-2-32]